MEHLDDADDFLCFGPLLLLWIAILVGSIAAITIDFDHVADTIHNHFFATQSGGIWEREQV